MKITGKDWLYTKIMGVFLALLPTVVAVVTRYPELTSLMYLLYIGLVVIFMVYIVVDLIVECIRTILLKMKRKNIEVN